MVMALKFMFYNCMDNLLKCCSPVVGMSAKHLNTYRNCHRTNTVPKPWAEHNQNQKPVCYGKMGWKYRLVKELRLIVMMLYCRIMSILLYHAGSNVMGQNPCTCIKFFFVVLFLRPSAPRFHPS